MWGRTLGSSLFVVFSLFLAFSDGAATSRPHIITIMADDLGWNDVSFHGSNQYLTPNIDALAYSGIILQNFYTQPLCTPARAALLTGRHPIRTGMQHSVIFAPQPWGLPLTERLLPQYLKELGYHTHGVGKWHLGFSKKEYTPTYRGFDSFFGSWTGHQNHFTHVAYNPHPGYDLHRDLETLLEPHRNYSTDMFTQEAEHIISKHDPTDPMFLYLSYTAPHAPVQAPKKEVKKHKHIRNHRRRKYAAMVTKIDESVGKVITALKDRNMLDNSIIMFMTDNGGATNNFNGNIASNWPLRGGKDTLWGGGVRGVGLIWSPLLKKSQKVHKDTFLMEDWLPTLLRTAGYKKELKNIDGRNQWNVLNDEEESPHIIFLHNRDQRRRIEALRWGKWKIIKGRTHRGHFDGWYGKEHSNKHYDVEKISESDVSLAISATSHPAPSVDVMEDLRREATVHCNVNAADNDIYDCNPKKDMCLFNLEKDPCEIKNLANVHPHIVHKMKYHMSFYHSEHPQNKRKDPHSYPEHWNHTWINWQDFEH